LERVPSIIVLPPRKIRFKGAKEQGYNLILYIFWNAGYSGISVPGKYGCISIKANPLAGI